LVKAIKEVNRSDYPIIYLEVDDGDQVCVELEGEAVKIICDLKMVHRIICDFVTSYLDGCL
jgi:hypothetical protein